jgi:hypothetical protein
VPQADRGDLAGGGTESRGRLQSRLAAFLKACPASVIVLEGAQVRRRRRAGPHAAACNMAPTMWAEHAHPCSSGARGCQLIC